jgi:hypothetical protein
MARPQSVRNSEIGAVTRSDIEPAARSQQEQLARRPFLHRPAEIMRLLEHGAQQRVLKLREPVGGIVGVKPPSSIICSL